MNAVEQYEQYYIHNVLLLSVFSSFTSCWRNTQSSCSTWNQVSDRARRLWVSLNATDLACCISVDVSACVGEELRVFSSLCCLSAFGSACHMCLFPPAGCGHVALPHPPEMHVGERDSASPGRSERCMLFESSKLTERDTSFISLHDSWLMREALMTLVIDQDWWTESCRDCWHQLGRFDWAQSWDWV